MTKDKAIKTARRLAKKYRATYAVYTNYVRAAKAGITDKYSSYYTMNNSYFHADAHPKSAMDCLVFQDGCVAYVS